MLQVLTVLCLVGASLAHMDGGEAMMKKYAYTKIMSSCFGEDVVMKYKMQMKAACDMCKGKDTTQTALNIQAMLKEMRKNYSPFSRRQQPMLVPVPFYMHQNQYQQFPQFQQTSSFRTKRHIDLSPDGIDKMRSKMMAKISNITCVLQEINALTADNQPNYAYFNEEVNNLQVDDTLKDDLLEAMDLCRDFATCMPVEKFKSPMKKELGTAMAFMKCVHKKKAIVCMKKDLKKYAPLMGYEGDVTMQEGQDLMDEITTMITESTDFMM